MKSPQEPLNITRMRADLRARARRQSALALTFLTTLTIAATALLWPLT